MKTELWSRRPAYEEVLALIDKDYKIKLPNSVALELYDSVAMSQFRADQAMTDEHGARADEHRDAAMGEAAAEAGVGKQNCLRSHNRCTSSRRAPMSSCDGTLRRRQRATSGACKNRPLSLGDR